MTRRMNNTQAKELPGKYKTCKIICLLYVSCFKCFPAIPAAVIAISYALKYFHANVSNFLRIVAITISTDMTLLYRTMVRQRSAAAAVAMVTMFIALLSFISYSDARKHLHALNCHKYNEHTFCSSRGMQQWRSQGYTSVA